MNSHQHLRQIAKLTQNHLHEMTIKYPSEQHDPIYRWEHTLRLANYGKIMAKAENADVKVVVAACLLHDIAHSEENSRRI